MAFALSKKHDYKHIAEKYSVSSSMQVELGKQLVTSVGIKEGHKVMDMGCGTGEITSFIAAQAGEDGETIGIDPDKERIKVASKQYGHAKNLRFIVDDSSTIYGKKSFEQYFDLHFSNFVFHWLLAKEKEAFLESAFKCLKPGGIIAINCPDMMPEMMINASELLSEDVSEYYRSPDRFKFVERSVAESMLNRHGFVILSSEHLMFDHKFSSLDDFITWYSASVYVDEEKIMTSKKAAFVKNINKDGTVNLVGTFYRIIGKKVDSCRSISG